MVVAYMRAQAVAFMGAVDGGKQVRRKMPIRLRDLKLPELFVVRLFYTTGNFT